MCWREFRIGCEMFGLSPAGRARVPIPPRGEGDEAEDDFIFGVGTRRGNEVSRSRSPPHLARP